MPFRNALIRIAASALYALRRDALIRPDIRLLAFSGTAGKTLALSATKHALQKTGRTAVSLPYGYTNELGIVLAMLGIEEPVRLHTPSGIRRILTSEAPRDAFVLVEVGADWREDARWFARRFHPSAIFLTALDPIAWARPIPDILADKAALIRVLAPGGYVVLSRSNPSFEALRALLSSRADITVLEFSPEPDTMSAHAEAEGHAAAYAGVLGDASARMFEGYEPPAERVSVRTYPEERTIVSDTYKAVPYCARSVLDCALALPAEKHILVISAMHPLRLSIREHYADLAERSARFDACYFVGPENVFAMLRAKNPGIQRITAASGYRNLARDIAKHSPPGTLVAVKGAGRYGLGSLVQELDSLFSEGKQSPS